MIDMLASTVLAWLLTYLIHSTVLLGLAWAFTRVRSWSPTALDLVWKTALVGGLVTATVQLALDVRPIGSMSLVRAAEPVPSAVAATSVSSDAVDPPATARRQADDARAFESPSPASFDADPAPLDSRPSLHTAAVLTWGLVGLVLAVAYAARHLILVGRLGDRLAVHDGKLLAELDLLSREAGLGRRPRLTCTERISSPIALGVGEICVPESALTELDEEQQRSMLAHELAHLARRDPLWLGFASVLERVLWIQPLNRVARRQITTSAEYLCDEWAVRRTGSGVALARCLAQVAEWIQTSPLGVPVTGMAEERSLLVARVEKLLAARSTAPRSRGVLVVASAGVVIATIVLAPSVTGSTARASDNVALARDAGRIASSLGAAPSAETSIDHEDASTSGAVVQEHAGLIPNSKAQEESLIANVASSEGRSPAAPSTQPRASRDSVVVQALIGRLRDEVAEVRRAAANALGKLEDPRAVPGLIAALGDRESEVRAAAAEALGNFHDPRAITGLSALLTDSDRDVRKQALEALSQYESGVPTDNILRLLQDPDDELRHAAAHAVGKWKDRRAGPALAALVRDPSAEVRASAIESLARLHDATHASAIQGALTDADADVRQQALDALEELRSPIPEATLINLLRDRNADVRSKAADIAGERSVIGTIPSLRRLLDDPDEDVRENAVEALAQMADDAAADALRAALNSKDANVRRAATEALGDRRQ
jgi:HEAT repeat protein/beta-lactamase regulating signal transducer with metallopeptidase domain